MSQTTEPSPTEHAVTGRRTVDTPIGRLTLVATDAGLRGILWPDDRAAGDPAGEHPHPVLDDAAAQLEGYFAGERTDFDVALDPVGTDFQLEAWRALRTIAYGETVSYGEQAERLGDRRKARAVGAANGQNPIPIIVPCHRVVGADGSLTGFAGGTETKAWLLDHERRHAGLTLDL